MKLRDWLMLSPVFLRCIGRLPVSHLLYLAKQFGNENPHRHNGKLHINTFFPPYPSKVFDRFIDTAIKRTRTPYSVYFAVMDECPFRCSHCSYGMHSKGRVDTNQALDVIEQIKSLGAMTIGFTGGEPLLRDDIVKLVGSVGDEIATIIFTTGYKLDKELAGRLLDAGLGCIMIGLESSDAAEHDKIRDVEGSFAQAIKAIEISLKAGLYTAISTVGTRDKINNGQIQKIAQLAEDSEVHEFRILEPMPTGSFCSNTDEVLSGDESNELADFHKKWNRRNRGPEICSFSYLESEEMFGCGAGFHHLFIDALGNVCPCDLTPLSFGNVFDEPLEKIWFNMGQLFVQPHCGCFMKEICRNTSVLGDGRQFPLDPKTSLDLCRTIDRDGKLPKIYEKLFKGQKPASQPLRQP